MMNFGVFDIYIYIIKKKNKKNKKKKKITIYKVILISNPHESI